MFCRDNSYLLIGKVLQCIVWIKCFCLLAIQTLQEIPFAAGLLAGVVDDSEVARRPRESTYPLICVNEAVQMVMAEADVSDVESVCLTG